MSQDVISAEEILAILDLYHIGKKPFSILLGWGETTILRYLDGDKPTKEYSDRLTTLKHNPYHYYQLLEQNKEVLTNIAYKKSKNAVLDYMFGKKINRVSHYLIHLFQGDITAKYLNFLLYFAQSFSLAIYDCELFEEDIKLNPGHIPYEDLFQSMKRDGFYDICDIESYVSEHEKQICFYVFKAFSWYGIRTLDAIVEKDFHYFRLGYEERKNSIITKEELRVYYTSQLKEFNIRSIREISKYPMHLLDFLIQE